MLTVSKTFEWDMGHRVTNHDSLCKNPHGHRYKMIVEVSGPLHTDHGTAKQGMVLDFGLLKQLVVVSIIDVLDHSFMYWEQDTVISLFATTNNSLKMHSVPFVPTVECIVQHIAAQLIELFSTHSSGVKLRSLQIFETPTSQALWTADND